MARRQKVRAIPRERLRTLAYDAIQFSYVEPPYPLDEIRSVLEEVVAEFEAAAPETTPDEEDDARHLTAPAPKETAPMNYPSDDAVRFEEMCRLAVSFLGFGDRAKIYDNEKEIVYLMRVAPRGSGLTMTSAAHTPSRKK